MKSLRSLGRHSPPAVADGWQRPSWAGLFVVMVVTAVAGAFDFVIVLYFTVLVWPFVALAAGLWSCLRQQAVEGALAVAVAVMVGGVGGSLLSPAIWHRETGPWRWSDFWTLAVLFFLWGLAIAPCVIAQSQRRFLARAPRTKSIVA